MAPSTVMRTVWSLGILVSMVLVGWYGPIPDFIESNGWRAPAPLRSTPDWNAALGCLICAFVCMAMYRRARRAASREAEKPEG